MNGRIQGLQMRAVRLVADDCANGDVLSLNTGSHQVQNLISQKFAELIVRECIRLCDQVDIVGADECIDNIKEHFGVEE